MRSRAISVILSVTLFFSLMLTVGYVGYGDSFVKEDVQQEPVEPELLIFENIHYGEHEKQTFDLSLPVDGRAETGLVVYLHGGGWRGGDKVTVKKSFDTFQPNSSYATASVNYRLVRDEIYDVYDIIEDITLSLEQIKTFAASYSVNLNKVILCGHSAGGHLSLLYAYKYKDISPIEPVGVFAAAPVPDLSLDSFFTDNPLGDEEYMCRFISKVLGKKFTPETRDTVKSFLDEHSPINYASHSAVPTVILHGELDRTAPFEGSKLLCERLTECRVNHELVVFKNTTHNLKNDKKTREYADRLMLACAKSWFGIMQDGSDIYN